MILEEITLTMSTCCMSYKDDNTEAENYDRVMKFMVGALAGHLNVISNLIMSGFDVHARIISRTLSEHIDLMLAIAIDPSIADLYFAASAEEDANKFWHGYVSKGKLRKKIISHLSSINPELADTWKECDNYVREEEKMIGTVIHPSYLSSAMIVFMGASHGQGGLGYLGVVDASSNRTLKFVIHRLFELLIIARNQIKESVSRNFSCEMPYDMSYIEQRIEYSTAISAYFVTKHHNIDALTANPLEM